MNNIQTLSQVSFLRVVLPVLAVIFVISIILRQQQNQPAGISIAGKVILSGLLIGYLFLYTYLTLSYRTPAQEPRMNLNLFWSYQEAFRIKKGVLRIRQPSIARQILLNVLVMIPVGLLMPLVYHRFRHLFLLTLLTGFAISVLTETMQYFTCLGLCELDDILHNTLGCLVGIFLFWLNNRIMSRIQKRHYIKEPQ